MYVWLQLPPIFELLSSSSSLRTHRFSMNSIIKFSIIILLYLHFNGFTLLLKHVGQARTRPGICCAGSQSKRAARGVDRADSSILYPLQALPIARHHLNSLGLRDKEVNKLPVACQQAAAASACPCTLHSGVFLKAQGTCNSYASIIEFSNRKQS